MKNFIANSAKFILLLSVVNLMACGQSDDVIITPDSNPEGYTDNSGVFNAGVLISTSLVSSIEEFEKKTGVSVEVEKNDSSTDASLFSDLSPDFNVSISKDKLRRNEEALLKHFTETILSNSSIQSALKDSKITQLVLKSPYNENQNIELNRVEKASNDLVLQLPITGSYSPNEVVNFIKSKGHYYPASNSAEFAN